MINIEEIANAVCTLAEELNLCRNSIVEILMDAEVLSSAQYSALIEFLEL